jgi:helix-turn-helix protein
MSKQLKKSARKAKRAPKDSDFANTPPSHVGALRFNDAARYLGIHPATLRRLWERGLIRSNRALRIHLFPVRELERFLEEGMSQ